MHSIHTLAHRAPPATRTRVRWQPYSALSTISSASPSSDSYLTTTPTSVASPASCDTPNAIQQTPQPQPPKDLPSREKNKYALGLVDQAVKSLSDIWRPTDIPQIFLTSNRTIDSHNTQPLISTPTKSTLAPLTSHNTAPQLFPTTESSSECLTPSRNLVPIKGFVHEVLRRSRTSASVLQTALCYLEAIRPKVPELARLERNGQPSMIEPELAERITPATEAELAAEAEFESGLDLHLSTITSEDSMDTVRVTDSGSTLVSSDPIIQPDCVTLKKPRSPSMPLPPLPPLPSPLLCPRRAFLASLILASKFTQDKCYSNRAWAKLSGLPPREIGRCERALGDALDWRLWVGKSPAPAPQASSPAAPSGAPRTLTKCQSESNLRLVASEPTAFLVASHKKAQASSSRSVNPAPTAMGAGLRRAATLPVEAFSTPNYAHHNAVAQWIHDGADQSMYSPSEASSALATPIAVDLQHLPQISPPSIPPGATASSSSTTPPTPGLSYSPSSTESSSGDRTIQMSGFLDDANVSIPFSNPVGSSGSDVWPWLDTSSSSGSPPNQGHTATNLQMSYSLATPPIGLGLGCVGKDWGHVVHPDSHGLARHGFAHTGQVPINGHAPFSLGFCSGKTQGIPPAGLGTDIGQIVDWNPKQQYCSLQA